MVKIRGGEVLVLESHGILFLGGEVLNSLVSLEVVFDVVDITLVVNPLESVRAISIHESVAIRSTSVREQDCDLMKSLWGVLPEVENHIWISQVGCWVSLLAVNEIWELHGIINEEDWGVVSDHVVVALLSIELNSKATWVSHGIWSTSLTGHSGESQEERGLLADLIQEGSLGELSDILGDLENTVSTGSLGMDHTLWNSLPVEVGDLVDQVEVLKHDWSLGSRSHRVLVVVNWGARRSSQSLSSVHLFFKLIIQILFALPFKLLHYSNKLIKEFEQIKSSKLLTPTNIIIKTI